MGVPPVIIHFRLGFSSTNHPAIGIPPIYGNMVHWPAIYCCFVALLRGFNSEVRPNDGKLEVFTREGPFGVARMRFRSSSIQNGERIGFQKPIQKFKRTIFGYYSMFSANFCQNWRRIFSCSACSALNPSFQKGSQRWITTFWRQRYWWDPMGCQVVTMTLNKKLLQTSWSCGDIPILCQPKKVEMQLKRGPQLVAKKMGVDGVDCWLAGLCWFMVSSLSLSIFII